ncbi:MAG: polymer-forming cytoskeletal protein [Oscillospiraceae bacterium]|nr:polymer-forming cytoskeletal protein [Oscillospiraceae bacterium]
MGFKDDFFEALRSVKRDFTREPEASVQPRPVGREIEQPEPPPVQNTAGSGDGVVPKLLEDTGDFRMPDNIITQDDRPPAPAKSDAEVMDAFRQAAASVNDSRGDSGDDLPGEVHTLAGGDSSTYIDYNPDARDNFSDSGDGRKIFDFAAGDMYTDDKTIISRNTLIKGNLQTEDSVRLLGAIMGDIDCKSNIVVAGKVQGNTSAHNAYIVDAQIDGDMVCDDTVNINKDAWILGNIRAQQAEIDGKIKGNIEIRHAVSIGPTSSVIGDISTDEIEIKRGAFVNGQLIMYSPSRDVIDRFEDFDRG